MSEREKIASGWTLEAALRSVPLQCGILCSGARCYCGHADIREAIHDLFAQLEAENVRLRAELAALRGD